MHLEIITPETKVFTGEATAVQFPGIDGLFQVLENHAPIISALKAGKIKIDLKETFNDENIHKDITVEGNQKTIHVAINGGVIEMLNNKIIVLAE